MLNIPIYRAKKIGSDEYIIGFYDGFTKTIKHERYDNSGNPYITKDEIDEAVSIVDGVLEYPDSLV